MLDAALDVASAGWPIFPCWWSGDRAKAPMTKTGFKAATTDPEQIRYWWTRAPEALIGIALPPNLVVLDIDPRHGGSMEELEKQLGPLPETLTVWSGRQDGGRHLYFRRPAGDLTSTALPKGVDLRIGGKHYLIGPPSKHPDTGASYVWQDRQVQQLPPVAIFRLRRAKRTPTTRPVSPDASRNGLLAFVAGAPEGERNSRLYWAACRAAENDDATGLEYLKIAAMNAGLSDLEARRTIESASYEMRNFERSPHGTHG